MSAQPEAWYEPAALPLLLEPDPPAEGAVRGGGGWRLRAGSDFQRRAIRCHDDDAQGALVQHALCRYIVHGVPRRVLAREIDYSERHIQGWVTGECWASYAAPVKRLLAEAGMLACRSGTANSRGTDRKLRARLEAMTGLLGEAAGLLDGDRRPEAERLRTLLRVLAAGREPLGGAS